MRTLLRIAFTGSLVFFVACGGGRDDSPPPNIGQCNPGCTENLNSAMLHLRALKDGLCDGYSNVLVSIAAARAAGPVPPPQFQSQLNGYQVNSCDSTFKNAIYECWHAQLKDGRPWIQDPASMPWLVRQVAQVLNRVGAVAGPALQPFGTSATQLLAQAPLQIGGFLQQGFIPRLSQGSPVNLNQFVGPYIPR